MKHELFKTVSRFAGREPVVAKDAGNGGAATVNIQINL
jgi:hypothetical protein